jgi:uncharacterized membrane protein YbhN (UPF0104 family)
VGEVRSASSHEPGELQTVAAISATFLYRLMSFWLPIPAGLVAGVFHRVKYG